MVVFDGWPSRLLQTIDCNNISFPPDSLERDDVTELAVMEFTTPAAGSRRLPRQGRYGSCVPSAMRQPNHRVLPGVKQVAGQGTRRPHEICCSRRRCLASARVSDAARAIIGCADASRPPTIAMFLETRLATAGCRRWRDSTGARLQARIADQADNCERIVAAVEAPCASLHQSESESRCANIIVRTCTAARQTTEQAFASECAATCQPKAGDCFWITLESVITIELVVHVRALRPVERGKRRAVWSPPPTGCCR